MLCASSAPYIGKNVTREKACRKIGWNFEKANMFASSKPNGYSEVPRVRVLTLE
jgi:hypothetical protein